MLRPHFWNRRPAACPRLRRAALVATLLTAAGAAASAATDACQGQPNCLDLGPFTAAVVKVNVTRQDGVTAYQGVRTTVRFTNVGDQPLILGYRDRSSSVTDNNGLAYRWSAKAYGIGIVGRNAADPQFQLAPGASRDASFDGVVQYSTRRQVAGNVFSHDITILQLAVVGPSQVRTLHEYALGFSDLRAGTSANALGAAAGSLAGTAASADAGPPADALQTVNKVVDLLKAFKK